MPTELKDILPKHFEKIGFDIKWFIRYTYPYWHSKDKTFDFEIDWIYRLYEEKEDWQWDIMEIYSHVDYATILTSKEYIDCLVEYIKKEYEKNPNNFQQVYEIDYKSEFSRSWTRNNIKLYIINWLDNWTIAEFINNITKDENI